MVILTAALWSKNYADEHEAVEAWNKGKDFKIMPSGPYCSVRDVALLKKEYGNVFIMYGSKNKTVLVA